MGSISVPSFFSATCPTCEAERTYTLNDGDKARLVGVYTCEDCGGEAELDLSP